MHAVLVRVTINDAEAATQHLHENVVPHVSQAPGLVAAYWVRLPDGDQGRSMLIFESEDSARQAAEQLVPPPDNAAVIDSVDVVEVVAST